MSRKRATQDNVVLRWRGLDAYLLGVPARDLTEDDLAEVERRGEYSAAELVASGLYDDLRRVDDGTESVS